MTQIQLNAATRLRAAAGEGVTGSIILVKTGQTLNWNATPETEVRRTLIKVQPTLGDFKYGRDWKFVATDQDDQLIVTEKHNKTFVGKTALRDLCKYLGIL